MDKEKVLLSRENYQNMSMNKFPGGGVEYGEGLEDALKREFMEELGLDIELRSLFYVNEFFQPSAFAKKDQIVSVYYFITLDEKNQELLRKKLSYEKEEGDTVFWRSLTEMSIEELNFPIDREVARRLKSNVGF